MKTPEEIKKGLECCTTSDCEGNKCPYFPIETKCFEGVMADALALIRQLEAENAQLKRERDAAIHDCGMFPCQTCEEKDNGDLCPMCTVKGSYRSLHQWRGPCEENGQASEPKKEENE